MSDIAIKVEEVGKLYRLGEVGTGTLSHDLNRWYARIRGKEDPFAKIGESNDRTSKGDSDYVWALQDVSFDVEKGEVLGIIGRNGAGKSTLLKLLSKVTKPTTGNIKVNGRIASLLEVGTGFHPEMTGRENIFLNGAIMGMTRKEIKSKFDEIVDFAGVERYVDTPVKRYSSGMYVRLAFAVAAHLEPEILIVDEVLAVGDAEFQKKCLGKMKDVSVNDGRTVLFVSHNMAAISGLCPRTVSLYRGRLHESGPSAQVIANYLQSNLDDENMEILPLNIGVNVIRNISFIQNGYHTSKLFQGIPFDFQFTVENNTSADFFIEFNVEIKTADGIPVTCFGNEFQRIDINCPPGSKEIRVRMEENLLRKGAYFINLYYKLVIAKTDMQNVYKEDVCRIEITEPLNDIEANSEWRFFPLGYQHGNMLTKIKIVS